MDDDRSAKRTPFGGIAFADLVMRALVDGPSLIRPAAPRPKRRNPKALAQKAQRVARKASRRSK